MVAVVGEQPDRAGGAVELRGGQIGFPERGTGHR